VFGNSSAFINIGVMNWVLGNVRDVCSPDQPDHFSCPGATVFFNASIIWGVIGPQRIFAFGMMYSDCLWFFLLGAILPIPIFLWVRKHRKHWLRYIHIPLIMGGASLHREILIIRSWHDSSRHTDELHLLGNCQVVPTFSLSYSQLHFQFPYQEEMVRVVDKVQLRSFCRSRYWSCDRDNLCLLRLIPVMMF